LSCPSKEEGQDNRMTKEGQDNAMTKRRRTRQYNDQKKKDKTIK
jgi:hypothetical protein